jgi:hypothetical protein
VIDDPSIFILIRKTVSLRRVLSTFAFRSEENAARRKWKSPPFIVYYESIKRELKTRPIYECRCDERLRTKPEESKRLSYATSVFSLMILLQQNKKSRESGKKCQPRNYDVQ